MLEGLAIAKQPQSDEHAGVAALPERRGAVLLLQGFLSTRRSLAALERRLRRDGHPVLSLELRGLGGRNTRGIDELAAKVRDEVERLQAEHPWLGRLTVIAHSMGGLVAAWWVKHLGGDRHVRALITLGTPHRGAPLAWAGVWLGWLAPCLPQMRPGSRFMRRLHEGAWPDGVTLLSVGSRRDRIAPFHATVVDGRIPGARQLELDVGHHDYLLRADVYSALHDELAPSPAGALASSALRAA